MHTLLLLGGKSRRFWPLSEKSLFPIAGTTIAAHMVEQLKEAGCGDLTIVAHDGNESMIRAQFPDLTVVLQKDVDGMQGAMLSALPAMGDEPVLIVSGNDVVETDAYKEVIKLMKKGVDGALLAREVETYFPGGYLTVDGEKITGIREKPGAGNEPSNLVNIVVHGHKKASELLAALKSAVAQNDDGYEQALDRLFKTHAYVAAPYTGAWHPVKYPWHMLDLLPHMLTSRKPSIHKSASIHETAVIDGHVIIEENVRVLPHACIKGPCFIGAGTIVGNNALVRGSSIGRECIVGYNTEVKDSLWHSQVWTHSNYMGDSVVGRNVSFGAGCVTGNLRLDEKNVTSMVKDSPIDTGRSKCGNFIGEGCRFGIQCGMNPGVKVGAHSFVAGGVMIERDVPEHSFVRMKNGVVEVRENNTRAPGMEEREKFKKHV